MMTYTLMAFLIGLISFSVLVTGTRTFSDIVDRGGVRLTTGIMFVISTSLFAFVVPLYLIAAST